MPQRRVLLVEDDEQMAELIKLMIQTAAPGTEVDWVSDVGSAIDLFSAQRHRLVLCDWNLPGKPGIALVEQLRAERGSVPLWMISGRTDRASVIAARSRGVDGFIAKPFQVEQVVARLRQLLDEPAAAAATTGSLLDHLAGLPDSALELPMMGRVQQLGAAASAEVLPDLAELAQRWSAEPALLARLLSMANSSTYNPGGVLFSHLEQALQRLGARTALNIAATLALRDGGELQDPRLALLAEQQFELGDRLAEQVGQLARAVGIDPAPCQTAALLHRLGELCVLQHVQLWQTRHGTMVDSSEIELALGRYARAFADRLKAHWRYPTRLRELIGAIYHLPPGTSAREKFVLRLAGAKVYGNLDADEQAKLERLARG